MGGLDLKKRMDKHNKPPTFNDGEIWWCGIGENVGTLPESDLENIKTSFRSLFM